jgi:DNA-directed RNA polymerase sigma subunit (sigma70/sigma32)
VALIHRRVRINKMSFTQEQVRTFHEQASQLLDLLADVIGSAEEFIEVMEDKDATEDDIGLMTEGLEKNLDELGGELVSLSQTVEGM